MELTIIGSASAEPNPGAASSCYLLDGGEGQLLLECGHGAAAKLLLYTEPKNIKVIIVSHMHPDHFFDLVPLRYLIAFNGLERIRLYLPPGGAQVLASLAASLGERSAFWEAAYDIRVLDVDGGLRTNGFEITTAPGHHFIPAWSMRIAATDTGRVLGYTSDTSLTEGIVAHMKNVDLLLAESSVEEHSTLESSQGHLTGEDAGLLAEMAGARRLVLTHYPHAKAAAMKAQAKSKYNAPCDIAVEGNRYIV